MPDLENEKEDQKYHIDQLLDSYNNVWIGQEFLSPLRSVFKRLPLPDLRRLAEKEPRFLAPDQNLYGRVRCSDCSLNRGDQFVYLSPVLLSRPRQELETRIAHELAHFVLDHREEPSSNAAADAAAGEREADALAEFWGFRLPESDKNRT
jgi:hypothetical protein